MIEIIRDEKNQIAMMAGEVESIEEVKAVIQSAIKNQVQRLDLSFSYCYNSTIPDSIGDIFSLKELTFYSKYCNAYGLQEISSSIGKLSSLTSLRISDAYYGPENLPESIGCLANLEEPCISSCSKLKELPMSIG